MSEPVRGEVPEVLTSDLLRRMKITPTLASDGRTAYFERFTAYTDWGRPAWVRLVLDVTVDEWGRASCLSLKAEKLDGLPLTATDLRRIPLARILRDASRASQLFAAALGPGVFGPPTPREARRIAADPCRRPRRGSPITRQHLEEVAQTYRDAFQRGDRPTRAVQATFSVERATASRWVRAARDAGLLPPAEPGRATA